MADLPFEIDIQEKQIDIVVRCETLPPDGTVGGITGGLSCTGFIDVEKIIKKIEPADALGAREVRIWFLEKKLPFQVLVLRLPNQEIGRVTTTTTTTTSTTTTTTSTTTTSTTTTSTTSTSTTSTSTTTTTTSTTTTSTSTTSTSSTTTTCPFHPRSQGFFAQNFFRPGTLTEAERDCAIACLENDSTFLLNFLTVTVPGAPPILGCPEIPLATCATFGPLDAACVARFESLFDATLAAPIITAACSQTVVPNQITNLLRQFAAVLLNVCICATGEQGDIGGVRFDCIVNLNRLADPLKTEAINLFGTATPTVLQVVVLGESYLDTFCSTGAVNPNIGTLTAVMTAMAQDPPATIIEC